ncbi:sensor domain-containing protein [Cohnella mopanensis]|uniref:sensor domain-containing protein n=1 Tax=Cohnella mopanensis TaxID=2911966 RepID=UPI001EF7BFB7|nr:sensor domain-containing diguanylate cyclase [Cohnella mopanensis]
MRNSKKVEHRLVSLTSLCFLLLFMEEYVRNQLPLDYSPELAAKWFSTIGILIPGIGFHLFIKLSNLDKKLPRFVYPYLFYLPVLFVLVNLFTNDKMISANEFYHEGLWKLPVYNKPYYIAMTASIVNNLLYLIPLMKVRANAKTRELREIYHQLIFGVLISATWFTVFGLIDFGSSLPPYPYLYGGVLWCFFLRQTMKKYDFLNFVDKRYEKMFNLNPAAILLLDHQGNIKEANPSAKQLFDRFRLDYAEFYALISEEIRQRIHNLEAISHVEMTLHNGDHRLDVLIDGDYLMVEYQPYIILILRDITKQKEDQREITFLAYHDPLTRLPNRRYFYDNLESAIQEAGNLQHKLAVVLIDLDYFKEINDKYGHQFGDQVLMHVANRIQETIAPDGMAARLGGDEFVFFIPSVTSMLQVESMIHHLQNSLEQHELLHAQHPISLSMSIGASLFPDNGKDGDALLNSADKAMYKVKHKGKNAYHILT